MKINCRFVIVFLLLLLSGTSFAQDTTKSKLVVVDELVYNSPIEEKVFNRYINDGNAEYFELFLSVSSTPTLNSSTLDANKHLFNSFVQELQPKLHGKSPKKQIKEIYKAVHNQFFKQYKIENSFSDIFTNGEYNCVSGTALYALTLDKLQINYSIKELPTHVYLVAFPTTDRILIEATDPTAGFYSYDERFKNVFVKQMAKAKLISDSELKTKSTSELFDQYYFSEEDITIKELAGIQYMNDAIYKIENENYDQAYQQLEKAYLLYPSERVSNLLLAAASFGLNKRQLHEPQYTDYFIKLTRFTSLGVQQNELVGEFARFTYDQLSNKFNVDHYDKMFERIQKNVKDTVLLKEIATIYYYEKGRVSYNKGAYTEALDFAEKACEVNPENINNIGLLNSAVAKKLLTVPSTTDKIKFLSDYSNRFKFVAENNLMQAQLLELYLIHMFESYDLGREGEGREYMELFEKTMQQSRSYDLIMDSNLLARAYSIAAVYYFKKGNEKRAKYLINKGLEFAPNNYELLQRKRMLN